MSGCLLPTRWILAASLVLTASAVQADDQYVQGAKSLSARDFDGSLPNQPIQAWLRAHVPREYQVVWGGVITDCGEGTGTPVDKERDLPLCAEVEIRKGPKAKGYLALLVGTRQRGLMKNGAGLYFGYLEHRGAKHEFKRLSDLLEVE